MIDVTSILLSQGNGPTAAEIAGRLYAPVRDVVASLNQARAAGTIRRTVEGDPVGPARWWPA